MTKQIKTYEIGAWRVEEQTDIESGRVRVRATVRESDESILSGTVGTVVVSEWAASLASAYSDPIVSFLCE